MPLGVLSILPALFSVMMLDAPGSESNLATLALVVSLFTFPVACAGATALSWIAYGSGALKMACMWALLPMINLVVGGAGLTWILVVQGGRFVS